MTTANVKVRGVTYRRIAAHSGNALGGKFFGKAIFLLAHPDGTFWEAYGKAVAHNSRLTPAKADRWPGHITTTTDNGGSTMHVKVTLNPAAFGLPNNPELPGPHFEFELDPAGEDDEDTCEIVYTITNSYPQEMLCDSRYADIVEGYRGQAMRSLSIGDTVELTSDGTTRRFTVATFGFTKEEA